MFAGIDIASERHVMVRLDDQGLPIGKPTPITEDHEGHARLLDLLGPVPVLVTMEATGHYWKNLFVVLTAAGHKVAVLNPYQARRFQDANMERTKTDAIDAAGLARLAFEKRPAPTDVPDAVAGELRELVRHRDRLRQDFDDRVRQLHRLVDLGFPEFTRIVQGLDTMLATCLLAEYPTAHAFARGTPRRIAKLVYDGRHKVGDERARRLVETAKRSVGQHHGHADAVQARHLCQDLDLWRRRLSDIERDIGTRLERHEVGALLPSIDGIGPQTAARIIAAVGDPARFKSPEAFAAYVGAIPCLRQSGKNSGRSRAPIGILGNARLRKALWMPVLSAVGRNPWLRTFYERLIAAGKPPKLAIIAAMRKLLHAIYSVAKNRKPFEIRPAPAAPAPSAPMLPTLQPQ